MEFLGTKLLKGGEEIDTASAFGPGIKAVALYFSAHWCPPCRGFTPKLAEMYKKDLKEKGLEVVFLSSDRDEASFKDYYAEQPWLALPYTARDKKEELSKKYKVQGIPSLVIIDAVTGETITKDGRSAVMRDPTGEKLPWKPPTFAEALGDKFLRGDATVGKEAVEGKTLGLYFSAHWCPPCRAFTPQLAKWYAGIKGEVGDKFEIIFVSGDREEAGMKSYYKEQCDAGGDWLCLPYEAKDNLDGLFEVKGIPTFIIVSPDGKVINQSGRSLVPAATASEFPWKPPAIGNLNDPDGINDTPSICLMLESLAPELQKKIIATVEPMAAKYADSDEPELLFFAATTPEGVASKIRGMCGLEAASTVQKDTVSADTPSVILMDIPDNGGYYAGRMSKDLDASGVQAMIDGWKAKTLERKQLG